MIKKIFMYIIALLGMWLTVSGTSFILVYGWLLLLKSIYVFLVVNFLILVFLMLSIEFLNKEKLLD